MKLTLMFHRKYSEAKNEHYNSVFILEMKLHVNV